MTWRFLSKCIVYCNIGLESLENFNINSVKCYCLIMSTEKIKKKFRSFPMIPERTENIFDITINFGITACLSSMKSCVRLGV